MKLLPVVFTFQEVSHRDTGEVVMAMVPLARYAKVAARQFTLLEEYPLVVLEARSRASHSQYFAALHEGFENLPESITPRWLNEEHMRKWILVEQGWYDETEVDCGTEREARRIAQGMATWARKHDTYTRISIHGSKIIMRDAKSQSAASMGKAAFEASKKSVLEMLDHMIGVAKGTLKKQAGKNA